MESFTAADIPLAAHAARYAALKAVDPSCPAAVAIELS